MSYPDENQTNGAADIEPGESSAPRVVDILDISSLEEEYPDSFCLQVILQNKLRSSGMMADYPEERQR